MCLCIDFFLLLHIATLISGIQGTNMSDFEEETQRNPVPESNLVKTEEVIDASEEEVAKSQALMQAVAEGKVDKVEELLKGGANHR